MSHRKRTSLRRWKARCALRPIPLTAIVEHRLDRWFVFAPIGHDADVYWAMMKNPEHRDG
jgi:hypothetical protein